MSNTQKATGGGYSLDKYREKAKKLADKNGPFPLQVSVDKTIEIPRPSTNQMFQAEAAINAGSSHGLITAICGDLAEEVLDLFGDEDFAAMGQFGEDLQKHFEIGQ